MSEIKIDDYVRLKQDIPENSLRRGEVGVVRGEAPVSSPSPRLEVEFHPVGHDCPICLWLEPAQVAVEEGTLLDPHKAIDEEMAGITD